MKTKSGKTTGELLAENPLSNSAQSEIAAALASLAAHLRSEFGDSCTKSLQELEAYVARLESGTKLSESTQSSLCDCLRSLTTQLDAWEKCSSADREQLSELGRMCRRLLQELSAFSTVHAAQKLAFDRLQTENQGLTTRQKTLEDLVRKLLTAHNSMAREFNTMKQSYQGLASELRRLDE